jgi:hypothetical protein
LAVKPFHHGHLQRTQIAAPRERVVGVRELQSHGFSLAERQPPEGVVSHAVIEFLGREVPAAAQQQEIPIEPRRAFGHALLKGRRSIDLRQQAVTDAVTMREGRD